MSGDDQMGAVFRHEIRALGVAFDTAAAADGLPTARCLILVTPDAQRTMQTFLGASVGLGPDDIDIDLISAARITYLEGYSGIRPGPRRPSFLPPPPPTRPAARWPSACPTPFAWTATGTISGTW